MRLSCRCFRSGSSNRSSRSAAGRKTVDVADDLQPSTHGAEPSPFDAIPRTTKFSEHPSTLTTMAQLARTHNLVGDLAKAEKLAVQGLETIEKVLGARHPDTFQSRATSDPDGSR